MLNSDFGLVHLAEPAIAESDSNVESKGPLVHELVDFLLAKERYGGNGWLGKTVMLDDGSERELVLRRMVELALNGGANESAAERAIALSEEPAELVGNLVSVCKMKNAFWARSSGCDF